MVKYEAFISYRRDGGKELAEYLKDELENNAILSFYDNEELHFGDFRRQLVKNNFNSKNLILLLSVKKDEDSGEIVSNALTRCKNKGDWVKREIICALMLHKRIIPIVYDGFSFDDLPEDGIYKILRQRVKEDEIRFNGTNQKDVAKQVIDKLREGWSTFERERVIEEIQKYKDSLEFYDDMDFKYSGYVEAYETYVEKSRTEIRKQIPAKMIFLLIGLAAIMATLFMWFGLEASFLENVGVSAFLGVPFAVFYYRNEGIVAATKKKSSFSMFFEGEPIKGLFALLKTLLLGLAADIALAIPMSILLEFASKSIVVVAAYCVVAFSIAALVPYIRVCAYLVLALYDLVAVYGSAYFHKMFLRKYRRNDIEQTISRVTFWIGGIATAIVAVVMIILMIGGVRIA